MPADGDCVPEADVDARAAYVRWIRAGSWKPLIHEQGAEKRVPFFVERVARGRGFFSSLLVKSTGPQHCQGGRARERSRRPTGSGARGGAARALGAGARRVRAPDGPPGLGGRPSARALTRAAGV